MIVEYFGIPGGGKSFFANQFKTELQLKCVPYLDLSRCKNTPLMLKIFYKLMEKFFLFIPKYKKIWNKLNELCVPVYEKKPNFLPYSIEYCVDRIVFCILLQDFFGKGNRITINDEGVLQWVVFLGIQYSIDVKDILSALPALKNCEVRFIQTPVDIAFSNIKKRNRHDCPMDEMDDESLLLYLQCFYEQSLLLGGLCKKMILSM